MRFTSGLGKSLTKIDAGSAELALKTMSVMGSSCNGISTSETNTPDSVSVKFQGSDASLISGSGKTVSFLFVMM